MASRDKIIAKAEKLVSKGKIEDAIKQYEAILRDSPSDVNTLNRVGDLWVRANKTQEAVNVFARIADHYSRDGFFLKAIAIFKKINKLDPSRLDVYEKLAELYSKQGLAMEAKSQYMVLADAAAKQGNTKSALETYKKIAELDPNSINVHVKLADLHHAAGDKAKALQQYEKVGRMLLKKGMVDESVQVFQKALKIDPDNVDLIGSLAAAMSEAGQSAQALSLLETAVSDNPSNGRLNALYGKTLLDAGQRSRAKTVLEEAVAVLPGDHDSRKALAELYVSESSSDLAQEILEPVVDATASSGDVSGAIALLNTVLSVDQSHVPTLRQIVEVYKKANQETKIITSLNALAEAHRARGENEEAAEALEQLLEREPENEQIRKKLALLRGSEPAVEEPAELEFESPAPPEPEPEITIEPEIEMDDSPVLEISTPPSVPLDFEESMESNDDEDEITTFIVEHMTEAEVFSKYGLVDRAIEHLIKVAERAPDHLPAYQRLFRAYLDEGQNEKAGEIASPLIALLRKSGEEDELRDVEDELSARGLSVSPADVGGRVAATTPNLEEDIEDLTLDDSGDAVLAVDADDSLPIEIEEISLEPEVEEISLEAEEQEAVEIEIEPEDIPIEIEMEPEPEAVEIELEPEAEPELELESETEPELELETVSEIELGEEAVEIEPEPEPKAPTPVDHAELSEVDFYITEQLYDEARDRLSDLSTLHPGSEEIAERFARIDKAEAERATATPPSLDIESELSSLLPDDDDLVEEPVAQKAPESPPVTMSEEDEESLFADEDDFFDLAAELEEELGGDLDGDFAVEDEEQSLEDVFREFKKGVEEQLDSEDYDTHYNLGIAYKEMGLIDEAIGEFQIASKDPQRAVECCSMLGLCFLEKGMPQLAVKWYTKGIELPETSEDEHLGLMYELGNAYQQIGDTAAAQKAFVEIYGVNSNYRDVADRIRQLQNA